MIEGRRHLSGPPYSHSSYWNPFAGWGPWRDGHLALDAIVAYVDDELSPGARDRATEHLTRCRECVAEVCAQLQARSALRSAGAPTLPGSLLEALRAIPQRAELPPAPPGLAVGPDGKFVSVLRDSPRGQQTTRPEAGQAPAPRQQPSGPAGSTQTARLVRLGASAAAGIALGALFAGAIPFTSVGPAPASGPSSEVLDARLQLGPTVGPEQQRRPPTAGPTATSTTPPVR